MDRTKVTSFEVAALAGVSQSAVSRVFTPGASASARTTAKVRKAADELGYRPNVLARAMVSGKSRIIGFVVAYFENQFYPVALELLSNALQARGYHLLVFTAPNSSDATQAVMQDLMDYQLDGIIAASVSMTSDLAKRARSAGIPVILFNRGQDANGFASVTSANVTGGRRVAEFLLAGGHERIAHVAGWQGSSTGRDRQTGFLQVLNEAGVQPFALYDGMYDRPVAMECARQLMQGDVKPDAIFVGNDHMAFAVIDVLREAGMTVGQDISVVGYDDVAQADWGAYDLTTIRQPVNRMVDSTVDLILRQIETKDTAAQSIEIEGDLILRGSARIPKDGLAPRMVLMNGFSDKFVDFPDYIIGITKEIWEDRGIATLHDYYAPDIVVRMPGSVSTGNQNVIAATMATLAEFPDRTLFGEDVIWSGTPEEGMLSSHRILSTATHLGDGVFGKATGKKLTYRILADCHARQNAIDDEWLIRDHSAILHQMGWDPVAFTRDLIAREGGPKHCIQPLTPANDIEGPYKGRGNSNEWGQRYADILGRIMQADMTVIEAEYDRAVHSEYPGGVTGHSFSPVDRFWMGLRASFPNAVFTIHHQIGRDDQHMPPRAAIRWSLTGKHEGYGRFGPPTDADVHVMGISHVEFGAVISGRIKVRREWTLFDEVAIWKQILLQTGNV